MTKIGRHLYRSHFSLTSRVYLDFLECNLKTASSFAVDAVDVLIVIYVKLYMLSYILMSILLVES